MARIIETATGPVEKDDVDPVTLDLIENGLRNARYEMDEVLFRTALSPGHPRAARRVPAHRRPRREDGRRPVRPVHPRLPRRVRRHHRGGRRPAHVGPVCLRCRDQPRQRLADRRSRSSTRAGSSAGPRCSGTCPTSAARRRRRCPPTRAPSTRRAWSSRPSSSTRKGVLNEDALRIILNQVRMPDWNRADLNGLVAACRTATRRVRRDVRPVRHRAPTSPRSTRCCSATTTR